MSKMKLDMRSALGGLSLVPDEPESTPPTEAAGPAPEPVTVAPPPTTEPAKTTVSKRTPAARKAPTEKPAARHAPPSEDTAGPRWTTFEAVTARLRPDQRAELTALARQLTKAKGGVGERITDNTIVRVAVDLLLSRGGELYGTN